ncbi:unnamed protein product [Nesidiocoris tenuis]|uniref:Uncharacterized protein n=1 Tax=Nesidiocoris tenuis TaxID=355587 RepID=A0A6H5HNS3_9HEMI|nr:unnamed protein product [Nesidiocoris tenuis]
MTIFLITSSNSGVPVENKPRIDKSIVPRPPFKGVPLITFSDSRSVGRAHQFFHGEHRLQTIRNTMELANVFLPGREDNATRVPSRTICHLMLIVSVVPRRSIRFPRWNRTRQWSKMS